MIRHPWRVRQHRELTLAHSAMVISQLFLSASALEETQDRVLLRPGFDQDVLARLT